MSSPTGAPPASARTPRVPSADPPRIAPWFPLVLAVGVAAAVWSLLVLPYRSAEHSQGEQDPVASSLVLGAFLTVIVGPLVAMLVGVWAATWAWLSWNELHPRDRAFLSVAAVLSLVVVALLFSPTGREIIRFWLD